MTEVSNTKRNPFAMDAEALGTLAMLRKTQPQSPELAILEGWQCIGNKDFEGAQKVLEAADKASPDQPMVKALLAMALISQGDGQWEFKLQEAKTLAVTEEARTVIRSLEAFIENCPPGANGSQLETMATLLQ
ncbi:MAG: HrpB1 family type III secretion system apparatus protein [Hydrogenophaga sp.]